MYPRLIQPRLEQHLAKGQNILLLGPRQTGKTTLIQQIEAARFLSFIQPRLRLRYEKDPSLLGDEIEALAEINSQVDGVLKLLLCLDALHHHRFAVGFAPASQSFGRL